MLLNIPGESHGRAYMYGLELLAAQDARFPVRITWEGAPADPTTQQLRALRTFRNAAAGWSIHAGEEHFWSNEAAKTTMKKHLLYLKQQGNAPRVLGFGWCWDMTWHNAPGGEPDPVYGVHWAGASEGGPDGDKRWGIDDEDLTLTGNHINLYTYINTINEYNQYAQANNIDTTVIFTTDPIDGYSGESGYQRFLKHKTIREYVKANGGVLLDFADILCWNEAGQENTTTWNGHVFPTGYPDLTGTLDYPGSQGPCHVSEAGCLKLGKAIWWMMARLAGWDGTPYVLDLEPPSSPLNLTVTPLSENEAALAWETATDNVAVAGYAILRDGIVVGLSLINAFLDKGLLPQTTYNYQVTAFDTSGLVAPPSPAIMCTILRPDLKTKVYYIDYTHGNDTNSGLSHDLAFQHVPDDPQATGIAATTFLQPGDTVLFKGGVAYHGQWAVTASGTSENRIVYRGDAWPGLEGIAAVLDGSEPLAGWQACQVPEDCNGNPHYASIYTTYIRPGTQPGAVNLHEYDERNQKDEFLWLVPATENISGLDKPGEYYVGGPEVDGRRKVYLWPRTMLNPENRITYSERNYSINLKAGSITIEGFKIIKTAGPGIGTYIGNATERTTFNPLREIIIRRNAFFHNSESETETSYGALFILLTDQVSITHNLFDANLQQRGIVLLGCMNIQATDNRLSKVLSEGITRSSLLAPNESNVGDPSTGSVPLAATQGQALFVGLYCDNLLFANNTLVAGFTPALVINNGTLYCYNNLIDAQNSGYNLGVIGSKSPTGDSAKSTLGFFNNVFINNGLNQALTIDDTIYESGMYNIYIINNILDGFTAHSTVTRFNNIYTGIPDGPYNSPLADLGEKLVEDLAALFVDPYKGNFHLKQGSPAVNAGSSILDLLPAAHFPGFDFTLDKDGRTRAGTAYWDLGIYESAFTELPPHLSLQQGLVGYWSFDEGNGTNAGDQSGFNHPAALLNGASWTDGKKMGRYGSMAWMMYYGLENRTRFV